MSSSLSFLWMMVQTILALAVVCGLAYFIFRIVLPKFSIGSGVGSMVRIVDRIGIDARKSLCVVEVAGKWMLIAISENGVQLVSELDAGSAAEAEKLAEQARALGRSAFTSEGISAKLGEVLGRRKKE